MARTVEQLTLFLASPGDVGEERTVVREVVEEVNRSFARARGIHLQVIGWDTDSYPSYGKDAQAILNDQIASMEEHDLFVGILWNRFGTPTPRAESGSEEEFNRAEESFKKVGHPQIMFYFCQRPANPRTQAEVEQKGKVLQFRERVQKGGATSDYEQVSEFRILFQRHLQLMLEARTPTTSNPSAPTASSPTAPNPPSSSATTNLSSSSPSSATTTVPQPPPAKAPNAEQISDSGDWTLLGTSFFESAEMNEKDDGTVVLKIQPHTAEDDAFFRALQNARQRRSGESLPFAYQNMAGTATVAEAERQSLQGKSVWTISLRLDESKRGYFTEIQYNDITPDEIAKMRARLILLNTSNTSGSGRDGGVKDRDVALQESFVRGAIGGGATTPEVSPVVDMWRRLKGQDEHFLPLARLLCVYHLLITNTVEHVLELTLGPTQGDKLHVRFRGRRHRYYTNVDPAEIIVDDDCKLPSS